MNYPVSLSFKLLALAPQIYVRDREGQLQMYVKQAMFRLKEAVSVYADDGQSQLLYTIKADRILDFNAEYQITDAAGSAIGSLKRHGRKSIFSANYEIFAGGTSVATIREESMWIRVLESLLSGLPLIGFLAIYLLNPTYLITRSDGTLILKLKKVPAFFEGRFEVSQEAPVDPGEEGRTLAAVLMMTLLERARG
jgi:uncharacterized protein YxjI